MMFNATGVILAGGKSSRIGRNKAFLEVSGRRIIDREIAVLSGIFKEVIIVCKDVEEYHEYPLRKVSDLVDYLSPLSGIYTGLKSAKTDRIFVVACDMPFLNKGVIDYLMSLADNYDVVVPRPAGRFEPLHAVYSKDCVKGIEDMFKAGNFRIYDLYNKVRTRVVEDGELKKIDPEGLGFLNVNTLAELEKLNK